MRFYIIFKNLISYKSNQKNSNDVKNKIIEKEIVTTIINDNFKLYIKRKTFQNYPKKKIDKCL